MKINVVLHKIQISRSSGWRWWNMNYFTGIQLDINGGSISLRSGTGPLQGLWGVLPHVDANKSVTRRYSSPALCGEQIVAFGEGWGGRSDLSGRSIYHRDKTLPILSADCQEPSAKHIQEMHASEYFHWINTPICKWRQYLRVEGSRGMRLLYFRCIFQI